MLATLFHLFGINLSLWLRQSLSRIQLGRQEPSYWPVCKIIGHDRRSSCAVLDEIEQSDQLVQVRTV